MIIKVRYLILFVLLLISLTLSASEKIQVERYEKWDHPILAVFKKYNISLYKVSYSKDGTCPTFHAKFEYNPDPHTPASDMYYDTVYREILKANSFYPYALVDEQDNLRINVGFEDKTKAVMMVHLDKANSPSTCKDGSGNPDNEAFTLTSEMKARVMQSPFKASLRRSDGQKMTAYLYAEDEKTEVFEYKSCTTGEKIKNNNKVGHYYIYLYDEGSKSFFPSRTPVLTRHNTVDMNIDGADFFALSSLDKKKSDVLLISQRANCDGSFYEVYGFWKDQVSLQEYAFVNDTDKIRSLLGRIDKSKLHDGSLVVAVTDEEKKTTKFKLSPSKTLGEIEMKPLH